MVTSVCASRETYVVVKMRFLAFLHICSGLEARSMRCLFCVVSTRVVSPDDLKTGKVLDELLSVYCDHSEGHDCLSMCTTCKTCMLKAPVSCMTLSCPLADHGHHFSGKLHAQHTGGLAVFPECTPLELPAAAVDASQEYFRLVGSLILSLCPQSILSGMGGYQLHKRLS